MLKVPLTPFLGSRMATLIVLRFYRLADATYVNRLILAGVDVKFVITSGASGLVFLGDPRASNSFVFWMLGGLGLAQLDQLTYPLLITMI